MFWVLISFRLRFKSAQFKTVEKANVGTQGIFLIKHIQVIYGWLFIYFLFITLQINCYTIFIYYFYFLLSVYTRFTVKAFAFLNIDTMPLLAFRNPKNPFSEKYMIRRLSINKLLTWCQDLIKPKYIVLLLINSISIKVLGN